MVLLLLSLGQFTHIISSNEIQSQMSSEQKALQRNRCDILVATPGRLLDHIENSGLTKQLTKVRVVILDEADRMLDMGFRNELKKIVSRREEIAEKNFRELTSWNLADVRHATKKYATSSIFTLFGYNSRRHS